MYISDLIDQFLYDLELKKGRKTRTITSYQLYLNRFLTICEDEINCGKAAGRKRLKPEDITMELVKRYRVRLNRTAINAPSKTMSPRTQACHVSALRSFLAYLVKQNIESLNPMLVEIPCYEAGKPEEISQEEVLRLIGSIQTKSETDQKREIACRDRALIAILAATGLKVPDVCALKRRDYSSDSGEVIVKRGGKRHEHIPVGRKFARYINQYLSERQDDSPALFISYARNMRKSGHGFKPLSPRTVERIVEARVSLAGLGKHITPQVLRKSGKNQRNSR